MSEVERLRECLKLAEAADKSRVVAERLWQEYLDGLHGDSAMSGPVYDSQRDKAKDASAFVEAGSAWLRTDAPALLARLEACEAERDKFLRWLRGADEGIRGCESQRLSEYMDAPEDEVNAAIDGREGGG